MKQLLLSCFALLLWNQSQGQTLESITNSYERFDSLLVQEKIYAQTDRSWYKPGDNIWFSVFVTNSQNAPSHLSEKIYAELYNPKGALVDRLTLPNIKGQVRGNFLLAPNGVGGPYKIRVYSYWMKNFSEENYFEKTLTVQKVVLPEVLMKLDFEREAYGVGDKVIANFEARTKDNQALADKTLSYSVQLEGELLCKKTATTDAKGQALLVFELPKKLNSSNNLINVQLENDGLTESISRSAPIVLNQLDLQLLPEGGNLVADYPARIGFKALNEFGKPADIKGQVVDGKGNVICAIESYHQGMGAFEFTPKKGEKYSVEILQPTGIQEKWALPNFDQAKIGLYVREQSTSNVRIDIYSPANQEINIVAIQKGQLFFEKKIQANQGANVLNIPTENLPIGIVQMTIFDAQQQPHAERLVFVNKDRNLKVSIKPNKEKYSPREEVKLNITVKDATGKAVQGHFSMAVVDDKQHTFADDKQDNILSYLLMSSELKGKIYEPNFYFDPTKEKANKALDYLMLTQGWRRFEWKEVLNTPMQVALEYSQENAQEISGFLKINEVLAKNQTIFLSEGQPRYTKKKAIAAVNTDENGFFKFEHVKLNYPAYLSANYHGEYHAIPIYTASQKGIKSRQIERYANPNTSTHDIYYVAKDQDVDFRGIVFDKGTREPLLGAEISLKKQGVRSFDTATDYMDGNFEISNVPADIYQLEVSYLGYQPFTLDSIQITGNQTAYIEVDMAEEMNLLETRTVTASRFESAVDPNGSIAINRVNPSRKGKRNNNPTFGSVDKKVNEREKEGKKMLTSEENEDSERTKIAQNDVIALAEKKEAKSGESLANTKTRGKNYAANSDKWRAQNLEERLRSGAEIVTDGVTVEQDELDLTEGNLSSLIRYIAPGVQAESYSISNKQSNNNRYNVNSNGMSDFNKKEGGLEIQQIAPKFVHYSTVRKFYQPNYKDQQNPATRTDFRKTIYWNPRIETNEKGQAKVSFYNSDEVTTFRAILEGNTATGQLAHQEQTYYSILPFNMITKIPTTLSFGDTINIPVVLKNNTNKELTGKFNAFVENQLALELLNEIPEDITISADSHQIIYLNYKVGFKQSTGKLNLAFEANKLKDAVTQVIDIRPKGFPVHFAMGGQEVEMSDSFLITDPYDGSMSSELNVYPDIMDGLMDGVKSILRSPSGCFEQVSSSNYPNILALKLMEQTGNLDAELRTTALSYLASGYKKLAAYEIIGGGFEWYGRLPAHEGLTAYGLVQFNDMQAVFDEVKPAMIKRTQDFLLKRRDGNGGFKQNVGKYGFSGNKTALFNAYITWALSEVHTKGIDKEVETMTKEAIQSEDLYRLSLACLTHYNIGNTERAGNLLTTIQDMIKKIGPEAVKAESTVTYSYGNALNIETLSFAALAMMRSDDRDEALLVDIIKLILSKRQHGRFGSTQSTIMALKALSTYYEVVSKVKEDGTVIVSINNKEVKRMEYSKDDKAKMNVKGLHEHFVKGQNSISIRFEGTENALPFSFDASWTAATPTSHPDCPVKMKTTFARTIATVGETVRMEVSIENLNEKALPSTMAIIGIPAGLSVQTWQLKEMQENKAFGFYEIKDNKLILYYSEMDGKETKQLAFDLKTEVPGVYTAPANAVYLYYGEEYKSWSAGTAISILP